jgi:hypothetical protein
MDMSSEKLRVGLLLDSFEVPAWLAKMLREIATSDYAEISLVVLNEADPSAPATPAPDGWIARIGQLGRAIVWKSTSFVYRTFVDKKPKLRDAQAPVCIRDLLAETPTMTVMPEQTRWSDTFPAGDLERIRSHKLDVLVRGGFRILRGGILTSPRHGVWSYHHGDNRVNRGGPPGFWESLEGWPETGSVLQILTEDLDNGRVLCRSWSCTREFSLRDNRSNYYWKSLSFIPRKLKELHRLGPDAFFDRVAEDNRHPEMYSQRLYTQPTATQFARLTLGKLWEKFRLMIERQFTFNQWVLLYSLRDNFSSSLWRYRKILPPKDRFWADPHVVQRDGRYYIFLEEYLYATKRGHISVMEMDEEGNWTQPVPVVERPYHLSYPFVFEHEGSLYMIPESAGNSTIELYKCERFPDQWVFQMNLMEDVLAVDATLLRRDGKWWLFANIVENRGASPWDELFVFHAPDFRTSDWTPHPRNPVVSDCKRSRPAGCFFEIDGRLYRPSQNCSVRYGYGFNFNEVRVLTETDYEEETVTSVEPDWDPKLLGTHTFNFAGRLYLGDGFLKRRK